MVEQAEAAAAVAVAAEHAANEGDPDGAAFRPPPQPRRAYLSLVPEFGRGYDENGRLLVGSEDQVYEDAIDLDPHPSDRIGLEDDDQTEAHGTEAAQEDGSVAAGTAAVEKLAIRGEPAVAEPQVVTAAAKKDPGQPLAVDGARGGAQPDQRQDYRRYQPDGMAAISCYYFKDWMYMPAASRACFIAWVPTNSEMAKQARLRGHGVRAQDAQDAQLAFMQTHEGVMPPRLDPEQLQFLLTGDVAPECPFGPPRSGKPGYRGLGIKRAPSLARRGAGPAPPGPSGDAAAAVPPPPPAAVVAAAAEAEADRPALAQAQPAKKEEKNNNTPDVIDRERKKTEENVESSDEEKEEPSEAESDHSDDPVGRDQDGSRAQRSERDRRHSRRSRTRSPTPERRRSSEYRREPRNISPARTGRLGRGGSPGGYAVRHSVSPRGRRASPSPPHSPARRRSRSPRRGHSPRRDPSRRERSPDRRHRSHNRTPRLRVTGGISGDFSGLTFSDGFAGVNRVPWETGESRGRPMATEARSYDPSLERERARLMEERFGHAHYHLVHLGAAQPVPFVDGRPGGRRRGEDESAWVRGNRDSGHGKKKQ